MDPFIPRQKFVAQESGQDNRKDGVDLDREDR
jgi:hypothetical protein